ncbi:uncharacterized protein LOC131161862 [Malania oleifera]|uniref:uncharacterized protein LOC131161862 n=1 Tax=Malania oleifera TaxID=397392 RepID=UPI0025ADD4A8|nr:uncharacterized protein LOC131161862 [Malania oleifera]
MQIKDYLYRKKLHLSLLGEEPATMKDEEWTLLDRQNYVAGDFGKVYLADGIALAVVGMGNIRMSLPNGSVWLLEKVTNGARVLAHGKKSGTLYMTSSPRDTIVVAKARKQKKVGFLKTGRTPKAKNLELVHTDLWGPSLVASLGGSRMQKTIPGTPQQNDVAERMNKTLNECARSMRLRVELPKIFWTDVVSTAA